MSEVRRKRRRKYRKRGKILTLILLVTILIFFGALFYINIIPFFWALLLLLLTLGLTFGLLTLSVSKKRILRIVGNTLTIILTIILIYIMTYLYSTIGFLFNVTDGDYVLNNYQVVVLKDSSYNDLNDLDNKSLGYSETIQNSTLKKIKKKLKKIDLDYYSYESTDTLTIALLNKDVEAIIMLDSELSLLEETNKTDYDKLKVIYSIELKNDISSLKDIANINKEPFNIYLSGIDTFGKINATSRSDVNIILTVNPKNGKILITWIPRDYYVKINETSYKDKLTHAGIYGINSSIYAVSKLLDIKINYYVKVNFTSVMEIVDSLGGLTFYNDYAFTTVDNKYYPAGEITLNGADTLTYVRERKNLEEGDVGRGKHQVIVLNALINKMTSKDVIKNYNALLKSMKNAFLTNMPHNTMIGFIKNEIKNPHNFKIESNILTGYDSYEYTYSYKNTKLYVMLPDEEKVNAAKAKIQEYLK